MPGCRRPWARSADQPGQVIGNGGDREYEVIVGELTQGQALKAEVGLDLGAELLMGAVGVMKRDYRRGNRGFSTEVGEIAVELVVETR